MNYSIRDFADTPRCGEASYRMLHDEASVSVLWDLAQALERELAEAKQGSKSELSVDHHCIWRKQYEELAAEIDKAVHKPGTDGATGFCDQCGGRIMCIDGEWRHGGDRGVFQCSSPLRPQPPHSEGGG